MRDLARTPRTARRAATVFLGGLVVSRAAAAMIHGTRLLPAPQHED